MEELNSQLRKSELGIANLLSKIIKLEEHSARLIYRSARLRYSAKIGVLSEKLEGLRDRHEHLLTKRRLAKAEAQAVQDANFARIRHAASYLHH